MFTIEQIHEAFNKAKSGADFPQFVQDLKLIGVLYYDNFVSDGRTIYFGLNNFMLQGVSKYLSIEVNNVSSCEKLKTASLHSLIQKADHQLSINDTLMWWKNRKLLLLLLLSACLLFPGLSGWGVLETSEARYAEISR
jgi:hypothetical protein